MSTIKLGLGVGGIVVVSNSAFGNDGREGVVIDVDLKDDYPYVVQFDGNDMDDAEAFEGRDLTVVNEQHKFAVGDKVIVSNSWGGFDGDTGTIITISEVHDNWPFNVEFDNGRSEIFNEEDLQLVVEKHEFAVGDKVRTVVGTVEAIFDPTGYANVNVRFPTDQSGGSFSRSFDSSTLELVEAAQKPEPVVGSIWQHSNSTVFYGRQYVYVGSGRYTPVNGQVVYDSNAGDIDISDFEEVKNDD